MNEISEIFYQILGIINEMSPYLLLGFLLAGLMHAFIPNSMYSRYLSGGDFKSVVYAALFGVPLPLCSCGVIPTAMSLRREGASKGATVSFLIATPQTGVDSIVATYSLMGLPYAVLRPVAALCTAVFGGMMVNFSTRSEASLPAPKPAKRSDDGSPAKKGLGERIREALSYGFVEMMEDIGKWLVVGLVVAGLITVLVPDSFFEVFKDNTLLSMLLVLAIAIPMYICATGSIPIAVALMMKGLTPGAALVMLMAGPACNVASILVVSKVLGRRALATYLFSIITGSILFGAGIDCLLPKEWFVPVMQCGDCCHGGGIDWRNMACTIILLALLAHAMIRHYRHPHCHAEGCEGKSARRLEFVVKGLNCNHCRGNAMRVVGEIEGVTGVDIELSTGKAWVEGEATMEQVKAAIEGLGFTVETP